MKITVFTSNQPRHIALVERLAKICDEIFVIQECNTVFPGQVDDFFKKSPVMQEYFGRVMGAEKRYFGEPRLMPREARVMSIKMGDLSLIDFSDFPSEALESDRYVVFGSSWIRGDLVDYLIIQGALNIHMGVAPFYRGSSCNFWALKHDEPEYVGATIHMLDEGIDCGPILCHALPTHDIGGDVFNVGMLAVVAAHQAVAAILSSPDYDKSDLYDPLVKGAGFYTKNRDFTDEVVKEFMEGGYLNVMHTRNRLKQRKFANYHRPFIGY